MKRVCQNEKTLHFFTRLPIDTISSSDLTARAKQRMNILRGLESKHDTKLINRFENECDDIESHFCMRLVAAQSLYSLKWFLGIETLYFKKSLENYEEKEITRFFFNEFLKKLSNIEMKNNYIYITQESQFSEPTKESIAKFDGINTKAFGIRIHFTKALYSLRTNLPENGYLELNKSTMEGCIGDIYCSYLEKKLYELYNAMKYDTDERLLSIHNEIFTIPVYDEINSLKELEALFPPCMSGIVEKLKNDRHLKYKDRLTITRFLKDMNVKIEETIGFFKNNFNVTEQVFKKEYLYSIRHSYGLEGKRASYKSYGCSHIIKKGDNVTFGCPFRFNEAYVMEYAEKRNIDIEDLNTYNECQIKCTKLLGKMSNLKIDEVINSPVTFVKTLKDAKYLKDKEINS